MRPPLTPKLTTPALRRHVSCKFLWWFLRTEYDLTTPQTLKLRTLSPLMGIKRETIRISLELLVVHRYLEVVVAPTRGTPGEYIAGPAAYGRHRERPDASGASMSGEPTVAAA